MDNSAKTGGEKRLRKDEAKRMLKKAYGRWNQLF